MSSLRKDFEEAIARAPGPDAPARAAYLSNITQTHATLLTLYSAASPAERGVILRFVKNAATRMWRHGAWPSALGLEIACLNVASRFEPGADAAYVKVETDKIILEAVLTQTPIDRLDRPAAAGGDDSTPNGPFDAATGPDRPALPPAARHRGAPDQAGCLRKDCRSNVAARISPVKLSKPPFGFPRTASEPTATPPCILLQFGTTAPAPSRATDYFEPGITVTVSCAVPSSRKPSCTAVARDTSSSLPLKNGPELLMRTSAVALVLGFTKANTVPFG